MTTPNENEKALLGFDFAAIDHMKPDELDKLPFGAIQLDEEGRVKSYNRYEQELARLTREGVIGKHFFKEVAPCTDVKEFHGRFLEGVKQKKLHAKFRYHFTFKHQPRDVQITLYYSDITHSVWVMVQPV
jgi:photoactive yellow protein